VKRSKYTLLKLVPRVSQNGHYNATIFVFNVNPKILMTLWLMERKGKQWSNMKGLLEFLITLKNHSHDYVTQIIFSNTFNNMWTPVTFPSAFV